MNWWPQVISLEFRKILAYRTEFWVTFLGQTLVQLLIARSLWVAIFETQNVTEMNGFTLPMLTLYYLIIPIGSRILTGENIGFLSREIYDGSFNRYLIYPLNWFSFKTMSYLAYSLFYSTQLIIIYLVYRFIYLDGVGLHDLINLLLGVSLFIYSSFIYLMLSTSVELCALWADNVWSLMVMLRFFSNFFGGALVPIVFFPEWAQNILMYTPFPNLVSLPAKTIMGISSSEEIIHGILVSAVWGIVLSQLIRFLWSRGQKNYAGVGI